MWNTIANISLPFDKQHRVGKKPNTLKINHKNQMSPQEPCNIFDMGLIGQKESNPLMIVHPRSLAKSSCTQHIVQEVKPGSFS